MKPGVIEFNSVILADKQELGVCGWSQNIFQRILFS